MSDIKEKSEQLKVEVMRTLLTRAADALEEACLERGIIGAPLIDELRKAAA